METPKTIRTAVIVLAGLALGAASAMAQVRCPDGRWYPDGRCTTCPDGQWITAPSCQRAPTGQWVPDYGKGLLRTPDGRWIPDGVGLVQCPDGRWYAGERCLLLPDRQWTGNPATSSAPRR